MGGEWTMEGLSLQSRMARMKLNTTLMLLKSSSIRTAEKIQVNKKEAVINQNKTSFIFVTIFVSTIFLLGLISLLGLHLYIFENLFLLISKNPIY
jgi:hypothetical protein